MTAELHYRGGGEIGGLPRGFKGDRARFEEYRDIPESIIVPQLQLMMGEKKKITISMLTSLRPDWHEQYGILDMEFKWDQIPHWFDADHARTPYGVEGDCRAFLEAHSDPRQRRVCHFTYMPVVE